MCRSPPLIKKGEEGKGVLPGRANFTTGYSPSSQNLRPLLGIVDFT